MLPDLPIIKEKLFAVQMDFMKQTTRQFMPAFGDCPVLRVFEGSQQGVERSTGDTEVRDFSVARASITTKPHEEDLGSIFAKLCDMAKQYAGQMEQNSFRNLNETLDKHGQTADAKGAPLNADMLLEAYRKIEIPLGPDGEVDIDGLRFVIAPGMEERMQAAILELRTSPEKSKLLEEIKQQKKEAALAREADRKLVG
jgi:hypothetical protein